MSIKYLERENKPKLAYRLLEGSNTSPAVLFCGGFRSDMEGTKAQFLEDCCRERGQAYVRFDYSGHGASEGDFEDGTIGKWKEDTLAILDQIVPPGPVLIVGSSMGGWLALLAALARPDRVTGVIGIAAAPDFTRDMYEDIFDDMMRNTLETQGYLDVPSEYSPEPYRITCRLIEDGRAHCLLEDTIGLAIPVRLLQGMKDSDVPWQKAYRIKNAVDNPDLVEVILIESGDHRLSRPEDLEFINEQIEALLG